MAAVSSQPPLHILGAAPDDRPASLRDAITQAERLLAAAGVDSPRLSAELLAAKAFGLSRLGLIMHAAEPPAHSCLADFSALVSRRALGEPAAYILGEKEFFGLNFRVSPDVLIPRPETELMVEEALRFFSPDAALRFADFGTGSGALAVALAHEFTAAQGLAIDLSESALGIAKHNAQANAVDGRLVFLHADFTRLALTPGSLDLVVSNPPYVTESEYAELSQEVRDFEPRSALVSSEAGLWHLRQLLPVAVASLRAGGLFLCELGSGQGPAALSLAEEQGASLERVSILKDYAGLDRILMGIRGSHKRGKLG